MQTPNRDFFNFKNHGRPLNSEPFKTGNQDRQEGQ
jgi:hypothetical protein